MSKGKKGSRDGRNNALLAQMGLIPGMGAGDDDDDEDLEAELLALQGMSAPQKAKKSPKKSGGGMGADSPLDLAAIDKMAQDCMNIGEDVDVDEEDSELLAELQQLSSDEEEPAPKVPTPQTSPSRPAPAAPPRRVSPVAAPRPLPAAPQHAPAGPSTPANMVGLLEERLQMYSSAYAAAQAGGNSSKARRMNRGVKTLKDLLKQAKAGKRIPEDDIPPEVHGGPMPAKPESTPMETGPSPQETPPVMQPTPVSPSREPAAAASISPETQKDISVMTERRDQYKLAALQAKRAGDLDSARRYFTTAKQFDSVIEAAQSGKPVDLSKMPPPPSSSPGGKTQPSPQGQAPQPAAAAASEEPELNVPEDSSVDKDLFGAPDAPKSVMEALQQRLQKYQSAADGAKKEGNSSKARRMTRIVKQYQDAIKAYKAGRTVDFNDLPTPPGFAPIPAETASPAKPPVATPPRQVPVQGTAASQPHISPAGPSPSPPKPAAKRRSGGKQQQQLAFLRERQTQFKQAALKAKQEGDRDQALDYLRKAKGFDGMIESLENGIRVDMSKVPRPPGMEEEALDSYEFVEEDECENPTDREDMFKKLEQDLVNQIRLCSSNSNHFTHTGDITAADRFDKLGQNCRKDLDSVKNAYKHGDPVPRFHYETKEFKLFKCCTDLGDNDLELIVVRGIHYNPPSGYSPDQLDTYVKYEFPFPTDDCPTGTTDTFKSSSCPEYNKSFKLAINRKSRSFQRMMKLKSIKFEVYYRRGFLKSDKVLGSCGLKLQPLENHCELHECLDLLDGRRPCGGRLEVRVRIREPLVAKEEEEVREKWLVIDKINRSLNPQPVQARARSRSPSASSGATSIEVLKFEKQLLDRKIISYQKQLTPTQITALQQKSQQLHNQGLEKQQELRQGGASAYQAYAASIEQSMEQYVQEAKACMARGDKEKAQVAMTKKKLVEKEVQAIRSKIPG